MIAPSLRTVSILMLLAGVALGIFAGTLMADDPEPALGVGRVEESARLKTEYYVETYGLNAVQADEIRQVFAWYERRLRDGLRTLWRENQDQFDALSHESDRRIQEVLKAAGVKPVAPKDDK